MIRGSGSEEWDVQPARRASAAISSQGASLSGQREGRPSVETRRPSMEADGYEGSMAMAPADYELAISNTAFFERMPRHHVKELCNVITHREYAEGDTIVQQGEDGFTFYIIHAGSARVFVADADASNTSTCVGMLQAGSSFGELALMGDGKRAASVVAAEPITLLCIDREPYQKLMRALHESDLDERSEFLRSIFLFSEWKPEPLRKLASVMTQRVFPPGSFVIHQGGVRMCTHARTHTADPRAHTRALSPPLSHPHA